MNPHIKACQDKLQALLSEAQGLQAKSEHTAEESARLASISTDITAAKQALDSANSLADSTASANTFLNGSGRVQNLAGITVGADQIQTMQQEVDRARGIVSQQTFVERAGTDLMRRGEDGRFVVQDAEGWAISSSQFAKISEPSYGAAFGRFLRAKADRADYVSLSEGSDAGGGYLVPPEWFAKVIMRKPHPTSLLNYIQSITCSRDKVIFPRVNYDSDTGDIYNSGIRIQWIGENGPTPSITDPVFGDVEIPIYTGQFPIEMSRNLLEDSAVNVSAIIQELAASAYNLGMDNVVVNGTGAGQPTGFLINPGGSGGLYPPSSNLSDPITADKLTGFVYALPPQYSDNEERTIAVMNRMSAFSTFAQIKDTSGQYIFGLARNDGPEGMANARRPLLMGYKVVFSAFMPNVATNAYPIAFGDFFEAYVLARRLGLAVMPYGDQDKSMLAQNRVGWMFRFRAGGQVVQNRAVHIGKQA